MAITWNEIPNSAKLTEDSAELHYLLEGGEYDVVLADQTVAYQLAVANSSVMFNGLYRSGVSIDEKGPLLYEAVIAYGTPDNKSPEEGDWKWSFDTTGSTKRVLHAIEHLASYKSASELALVDHAGIIGFAEKGEADGVDVPDHSFKWTETRQLALASFGFSYASILGAYTGMVNNATFRGKPAYTVLFGGASGGNSEQNKDLVEITYHFEYKPNEQNVTFGDITVPSKIGWDVASVCVKPFDDPAMHISAKPYQVDIDRVFRSFNFSLLGIGTI